MSTYVKPNMEGVWEIRCSHPACANGEYEEVYGKVVATAPDGVTALDYVEEHAAGHDYAAGHDQ